MSIVTNSKSNWTDNRKFNKTSQLLINVVHE